MTGLRRRYARIGFVLCALASAAASANDDDDRQLTSGARPYGTLLRALLGPALEREHGIGLLGFVHATAALSNHDIASTLLPQGRGRNIQPQAGVPQDEGLNLNQLGVILCKDDACPPWRLFEPQRNVLSRVGPLPGARGDAIRVDWLISAIYGEDAVFWKTKGFDDWRWDAGSRDKLALTQWFLDIYLPIGAGASVLLGSFQNPLALEVGYGSFVPPNWFASRSYAFVAGPSKQVGALAQFKLPLAPALGVASASVGVVSDWNSFDLGAGAPMPGFIGIVSWRSPDLATWLDVEFMYANGEDDFGDVTRVDDTLRPLGGGTQYLALSSTDEVLDRFIGYVTLVHAFDQRTRIALEAVYGHQEAGDRAPLPFTITRHSPFYGVNVAIRRQLHERVHVGLRAEWFADDHAASILWSGVGATGGDVYALTASLAWEPSPHVLLRPELKFDVYAGGGHLFATARDGRAREDAQLLGVVNLELRF